MLKPIQCLIVRFLRRCGGEFHVWMQPHLPENRWVPKRKYHVVIMSEMQYHAMKMNTTWQRGNGL
jgi:hypothetical protein